MTEKPDLRNIGAAIARNHFNGVPVEFIVPPNAKVVVVSDMFVKDYQGGAELTTEAFVQKAPYETFKVHSQSLTVDMLERYKNRHWIICNFTAVDVSALAYLAESTDIKYSVVEYDYKYCMYRSEVLHKKQTGHECDCPLRPHGILVEKLYTNAQKVFWMSEKQKEHYFARIPSLIFSDVEKHVVIGSMFDDETLDTLTSLRLEKQNITKKSPVKIWGVQGSQNWIKGTKETIEECSKSRIPVKILQNMEYGKFLQELSRCDGFIFKPLDFDTCPRVVIEAKLVGCELSLNDNVQHKDEEWFCKTPEEITEHLKKKTDLFWSHISL